MESIFIGCSEWLSKKILVSLFRFSGCSPAFYFIPGILDFHVYFFAKGVGCHIGGPAYEVAPPADAERRYSGDE